MSEIKIQEIVVDDETTLEVSRYGSGKPSILLVSGVHGNEKTGPALLRHLGDQLVSAEILGGVSLLPVASPKAYSANQRDHPDDGHDLNRCFLGGVASENSPSGKLVIAIQQLVDQHEVVIDIHGFPHQMTPIVGVFLREGDMITRRRSGELLRAFDPEVIWELGDQEDEANKAGSACSYALQRKGIPAFGFELADPEYYSEVQRNRIIRGFLRVLGKVGCIAASSPEPDHHIPRYEDRRVNRAPKAGIFIPRKRLFEAVTQGVAVGELGGDSESCRAKQDGIVLTIAPEGQLQVKQKMFATAVPISV